MVTKSKLKMALAAEKGTDFQKLKEKKQRKEASKRKAATEAARGASENDPSEEDEGEEHDGVETSDESEGSGGEDNIRNGLNLDAVDDSDTSDSSVDMEEKLPRKPKAQAKKPNGKAENAVEGDEEDEDEEEEEEEEEDIPVSDLEDLDEDEKEDLIRHSRLTINNTSALLAALKRISIPTDKSARFATHQSITAATETAASIPDVSDDLQRELAFYSQSLEAVRQARTRLRAEGVPFSRPKDYFAEMVKEDAHMEKVKAKLVEESSAKKAAAEARKLRDLKKFGKQVQVAKLQEKQKAKRETLEKIKTLKRKRQESSGDLGTHEADMFDVGVDNELAKHSQRSGSGRGQIGGKGNNKRQKKDQKYGFGGKKRHAKSGDFASSSDLSGFDAKKMKAGGRVSKARPGKSRRKAMASR